ncbi:MAG TPA: carbohydrate ABC transporter permease [Jiangellaceae bacterium]|nr:carbohydrate ABC transporter permease [Jiangellaceae bacterium]
MSVTSTLDPMAASVQSDPGGGAPSAQKRRQRRRDRILLFGPLTLYVIFTIVPFYWMLLFALRPAGSSSLLPWPITFEHFETVWVGAGFGVYFKNSVLVAITSLVLTTAVALLGGYAIARYKFRGKGLFMVVMLCTQFIPGAMMLIPLFDIFRTVGLINSLASLIVADTVFQLPLSIILMYGFVRNIPVELEEAAWMDGCSRVRGFLAIMLPLMRPAIVAVGSFAFINAWNNFLFALMFLNVQDRFTVPVGLSYMLGEFSVDFGALAAGGVVAALPVVLVFAYVQKFLVQGLSAGAVKG